jgi:hypothetical protein
MTPSTHGTALSRHPSTTTTPFEEILNKLIQTKSPTPTPERQHPTLSVPDELRHPALSVLDELRHTLKEVTTKAAVRAIGDHIASRVRHQNSVQADHQIARGMVEDQDAIIPFLNPYHLVDGGRLDSMIDQGMDWVCHQVTARRIPSASVQQSAPLDRRHLPESPETLRGIDDARAPGTDQERPADEFAQDFFVSGGEHVAFNSPQAAHDFSQLLEFLHSSPFVTGDNDSEPG